MSSLRSFFSRLRNSVRKEQLDNELRAHVELHVEDNLRAGMTPEAARRGALVKLGGVEQTKEKHRDSRAMPFFESLSQDVRFAIRMLRKSPGFTAAAILTLALGIGANVAIFTLINGLLLRLLPYPQPESVVTVDRQFKDGTAYGMSFIKFRRFERQNRSFESLAAYDILGSGLNLVTASDSELVQSRRVSSDFFRASYSVEERSREIGIRISLGAGAGRILSLVLGDGMRLTLTGTLVGLGSGLLLTKIFRGLFFGLTAANPFIFTAVPVLLTLVSLVACYIPARRATRVDPMTALRYE